MWYHVPGVEPDLDAPADARVWVTLSGKAEQRPLAKWIGWKKRPWISLLSSTVRDQPAARSALRSLLNTPTPTIPSPPRCRGTWRCAAATQGLNSPSSWLACRIGLCAMLSETATQQAFSWPACETAPSTTPPSGTTSPPSTPAHGEDASTSSPPGSPANRSRRPDEASELTMTVTSGRTRTTSSVTWDPDSCCWRTSLESCTPSSDGSKVSSATLPRWGSMRSGVCSQRPPLGHPIDANGSGSSLLDVTLWGTPTAAAGQNKSEQMVRGNLTLLGEARAEEYPTPTAGDAKQTRCSPAAREQGFDGTLTDLAASWPTPRASANENRTTRHAPSHDGNQHGQTLAAAALEEPTTDEWPTPRASEAFRGTDPERGPRGGSPGLKHVATEVWPTPMASNAKEPAGAPAQADRNTPTLTGAVALDSGPQGEETATAGPTGSPRADLNPRFVESLMNLPDGWSDPLTALPIDFTFWVTVWSRCVPLPGSSSLPLDSA